MTQTPASQIAAAATAQGWQVPPKWISSAALLWLLPSTAVAELPVLPKFHHGDPQQLTFEKALDKNQRLVIRLWPTEFLMDAGAAKSQLWNGMVTRERQGHPGKLITVTSTDTDFATHVEDLDELARSSHLKVQTELKRKIPTLLIW